MDRMCLVLPVLPGRSVDARAFLGQLDRARRQASDERRSSITREAWYAAEVSGREALVAHIEAEDFARAAALLSASRDPFDLWFKDQLAQATGLDISDPPELVLPELLSAHSADARVEASTLDPGRSG